MLPAHLEPDWIVRLVGTPYNENGQTPEEGFPCWAMCRWVYNQIGIPVPGKPIGWRKYFDELDKDSPVQRYDLLCFQNLDRIVDHVGVAISSKDFVHADEKKQQVVCEPIIKYQLYLVAIFRPKAEIHDP